MSSRFDYAIACNPANSVIVSACAGSGKTWLLVARMVRLLLAGANPQAILALTFTRKAAQEMRDRLYSLLEQFSTMDDQQLIHELTIRGLGEQEALTLLPEARALYLKILMSPQPIVIDTFHGWFGRLLGAAPVSAEVQPGFSLREDAKRLQEECMEDWWSALPERLRNDYDVLLKEFGAIETQKFLMGNYSLFKQRGAWTFFLEACKSAGISPIEFLDRNLPTLGLPNPLENFWQKPTTRADLEILYKAFSNGTPTQKAKAPLLEELLVHHAAGGSILDFTKQWQAYFFTQKGQPLKENAEISVPMGAYLATSNIDPEIIKSIRAQWVDAFQQYFIWQSEALIHELNLAWFNLSQAMLAHMESRKESMRVRDFDDLEIGVSQLMADPANSSYLQARLDAKYRHILIDEFQDTNPLQWQILQSWLEGYGQDTSRPSVFIVGDPKQSIYRFRRADPRLFDSARAFLLANLQAHYLEQNTTRRNAPAINDAVNAVFSTESLPSSYPFHQQETAWKASAKGISKETYASLGEAQLLPLIAREEMELPERLGTALDNSIQDLGQTVGVQQRYLEGQQVSRLIQHILATRQVLDKKDGKEYWRAARASDFILLVKRRQYLPQFERALREAGLAYDSSRLGGLLNTLEIDDLIALLRVLVSPRHDLPLAQVLRCPIFSFTEEQMQMLSMQVGPEACASWWDALQSSDDLEIQKAARYLERWRQLGEALPPHDLLDLIYQESDLRRQYAAASQHLARAQVLANLDAFLELALNHEGGRYPSLSRFIAEINAMRRGDDDETPDEGDVEANFEEEIFEADLDSEISEDERNKRVRLMTIHGAKGLEAPFVIILDANHTEWRAPHRGVLLDWPPEQSSPTHLSLYTVKTLTGQRVITYDAENEVGQNENWNVLYVAMTRAQQGLWISGVEAYKKGGINEKSWYGRALAAGITCIELDQLPAALDLSLDIPELALADHASFKMEHYQIAWDPAKQSHQEKMAQIESGIAMQELIDVAIDDEPDPDPDILDEGIHFHKLLEFMIGQSGVSLHASTIPTISELMNWFGISEEDAQTLLRRVGRVLGAAELEPFLNSNEWIAAWNELDIATADGKSYRIDRLVEFDDHLAILDYKLTIPEVGTELYGKYLAQLQVYKTELSRIRRDKPSKAYLVSSMGTLSQVL